MVHSCHLLPLSYWWKKICIEALRHCETICFWMPWQGSSGIPAVCSYWRSRQLESGAVAVCSQSQFWEGSLKALCWFWLSEKVLLLCYFINLVSVQWPQYFILTRPFPPLWHNTSLLHPSLTSPCYVGMWLFLVSIWECGKKGASYFLCSLLPSVDLAVRKVLALKENLHLKLPDVENAVFCGWWLMCQPAGCLLSCCCWKPKLARSLWLLALTCLCVSVLLSQHHWFVWPVWSGWRQTPEYISRKWVTSCLLTERRIIDMRLWEICKGESYFKYTNNRNFRSKHEEF